MVPPLTRRKTGYLCRFIIIQIYVDLLLFRYHDMLLRVLEISKVFVCILKCMYIMLCSIISVRQQPNVALYICYTG